MPEQIQGDCETCDGYGEVCVGFGIYSEMRPGIKRCPDCDGTGEAPADPRAAVIREVLIAATDMIPHGSEPYAGWSAVLADRIVEALDQPAPRKERTDA